MKISNYPTKPALFPPEELELFQQEEEEEKRKVKAKIIDVSPEGQTLFLGVQGTEQKQCCWKLTLCTCVQT